MSILGIVLGMIFWFPVGIVAAAAGFYYGQRWLAIVREARSGRVREAHCPTCGSLIHFWIAAFDCPICTRRLVQRGDRLYDMSLGSGPSSR